MIAIGAVIVLYNKLCAASASLNTLLKQTGLKPLTCLADNSENREIAAENADISVKLGLNYLDMGGNKGLTAAYNRAIDKLVDHCDWIVLFDDDTEVPTDFCMCLQEATAQSPETDIFLPWVEDDKGLLSPCRTDGYRFRRLSADQICHLVRQGASRLSAVNTGMAIRATRFAGYRYDPHLFLDCVDHLFLHQMKQGGAAIGILDVRLQQQFADSHASCAEKLGRFRIYAQDYAYYCWITRQNKLVCRTMLFSRACKLAWQCKDTAFFRQMRTVAET